MSCIRVVHIEDERADVELIARALRHDYESLRDDAQLPAAGLVWWRSTIRARAEASRRVERPITAVHACAAACVIALLPVLIVFLVFRTRIIDGVAFIGMKT